MDEDVMMRELEGTTLDKFRKPNIQFTWRTVRCSEKSRLKVLFANLSWEKNTSRKSTTYKTSEQAPRVKYAIWTSIAIQKSTLELTETRI